MLGVRIVVRGRMRVRRFVMADWGRRGEPVVETITWGC